MGQFAVRADEYLTLERKQVEFVVWDLVPRPGLTVVAGKPFVGKSLLALQLAQAVARGKPFLNRDSIQGRVLYFILESVMVWEDRLRKLKSRQFDLACDVFLPHPDTRPPRVNILEADSRKWIKAVIDEVTPDLIILDPFRELHNADEDSSTEMKVVGDYVMSLAREAAVVVVHHTKKLQTTRDGRPPVMDPVDALRGSSYLAGKADTVWLLHKEDESKPWGTLRTVPRFADRETIPLAQDPTTGLWGTVAGRTPAAVPAPEPTPTAHAPLVPALPPVPLEAATVPSQLLPGAFRPTRRRG